MVYMGFKKVKGDIESKLEDKGEGSEAAEKKAGAIAASIGRKKYGKKKFQSAAAHGKKMHAMSGYSNAS
jgi:hypothetical protein